MKVLNETWTLDLLTALEVLKTLRAKAEDYHLKTCLGAKLMRGGIVMLNVLNWHDVEDKLVGMPAREWLDLVHHNYRVREQGAGRRAPALIIPASPTAETM